MSYFSGLFETRGGRPTHRCSYNLEDTRIYDTSRWINPDVLDTFSRWQTSMLDARNRWADNYSSREMANHPRVAPLWKPMLLMRDNN